MDPNQAVGTVVWWHLWVIALGVVAWCSFRLGAWWTRRTRLDGMTPAQALEAGKAEVKEAMSNAEIAAEARVAGLTSLLAKARAELAEARKK